MLSKYQDENGETQRLEINNNENGHSRYSGLVHLPHIAIFERIVRKAKEEIERARNR